jgi:hypothetical protein
MFTGQADRVVASGTTVVTEQLSMHFDVIGTRVPRHPLGALTLIGSVIKDPSKPAPGLKKSAQVTLTNFLPNRGDLHGPRNGSYNWVREPGIGGEFSYTDSIMLLCPSDPTHGPSTIDVVERFYTATDGTTHLRSDASATDGWIPVGDTLLQGTCVHAIGQFELQKVEDASGNTLSGTTTGDPAACDPAFGSFPSLTNNATDYVFASSPTFPGEW